MGCRQVPLLGALLCLRLARSIMTRITPTRIVHIADLGDVVDTVLFCASYLTRLWTRIVRSSHTTYIHPTYVCNRSRSLATTEPAKKAPENLSFIHTLPLHFWIASFFPCSAMFYLFHLFRFMYTGLHVVWRPCLFVPQALCSCSNFLVWSSCSFAHLYEQLSSVYLHTKMLSVVSSYLAFGTS